MSEDFVNGDDTDQVGIGWARLARGDLQGAESAFRLVAATSAGRADALTGLAQIFLARGDWARAAGLAGMAARASRSESQHAGSHAALGRALLRLGHSEAARAALHVALLHDPLHIQANADLADALIALGRLDEALNLVDAIVVPAQTDVGLRLKRAQILGLIGRHDEAAWEFRVIADLRPDDPAAAANLGAGLFASGDLDAAAEALDQAVRIGSATPETLNNIGLVAMARGDLERAGHALHDAHQATPADPRIANNYATVLQELGSHAEAERLYRGIAGTEDGLEASRAGFNLGTLMLGSGRWSEGWRFFEQRLALAIPAGSGLPDWRGDSGTGCVLIEAEQGLGDVIQFARFLSAAAARVPVVVRLPETAAGLLDMIPALRAFPPGHIRTADADDAECFARCSLLSLPAILEAGAPSNAPYLAAGPVGTRSPGTEPVVGIGWRGSPRYRFDRRRSLQLAQLAPLLATRGVTWWNLQRDIDVPGLRSVDLTTLKATADAIMACDLVIAVDTAVAHLAGALGRPVWLLNRFGGDWRWYDAPHSDGLAPGGWYRDLVQFQPEQPSPPPGCWEDVILNVGRALRARFGL